MKRCKVISFFLAMVLFTAGCSNHVTESQMQEENAEVPDLFPQEISWEIAYEVPTSSVKVLVDREGYLADRDKIACFRGEELGKTFQLIDSKTDEVVYTGNIENKAFDKISGEYVSQGDFSDFVTEGTYYIETDIIGRSYSFTIQKDIYTNLFEKLFANSLFSYVDITKMDEYIQSDIDLPAYQEMINRKDVYEECMALNAQGLAMQYYPYCYEQLNERLSQEKNIMQDIYNEAEWLLLMQEKDGSVHAGMYQQETGSDVFIAPVSREATAAFCGSMAITAKLFENTDKELSKKYIQAAKSAWRAVKQGGEDVESFYADAWLLWCMKDKNYLNSTTKYLKDNNLTIKGNHLALYGALAYVSAEVKTDTKICADLMKSIMEISEDTAAVIKESPYHIYESDMVECYDRLLTISIANYVVPSNEYVRVLEHHLHYLLGRNKNGYRYITEDGIMLATTDMIGKTREWDGIIRFMMSSILSASMDKEE